MVKIPSRDKPRPPDSAGRAAGSVEAQAEVLGSSCSVVEVGVARRVDRQELVHYGERND
jgi:hypothetical protein